MSLVQIRNAMNRRSFLAGCAGCAAAALCRQTSTAAVHAGPTGTELIPQTKTRLRLVFSHIAPDTATWPYQGYDYEGRKKELLAKLKMACPRVEFLPVTARSADEARQILKADSEVDGYLNYMIGIWSGASGVLAESGRPVLFVDDLYAGSGEFLVQYAAARRKGLRVAGISSSRFDDVVQGVKAFECLAKLKQSVILDVLDKADTGPQGRAIQDVFETQVRKVDSVELNEAYRKADLSRAKLAAQSWVKGAKRVVEPSAEEINKSGVMYVAMADLLQQHKGQAVAMDCLHLFYGGKLPAYPCMGFFQFNNDGLVGACEADLPSTVSMLLMTYLVGKPGYISDPVIDTSKNQIIYAHCVSMSKVYGPDGASNPYEIRSHSEDRKGAAVRSLMPLGETVSTLKFDPVKKQVVFHTAKTVANIDEDKACRTKLAAEVKDIYKLMREWDKWGWHRVTFYGDHRQAVETISALAGFEVVVEG